MAKKPLKPSGVEKKTPSTNEVHALDFPDLDKKPIDGLTQDAHCYISTLARAFQCGQALFHTPIPTAEDWAILLVVINNEASGRATVTKNIVEVTGRAFGTVRAALLRFEKLGYI